MGFYQFNLLKRKHHGNYQHLKKNVQQKPRGKNNSVGRVVLLFAPNVSVFSC